jgi:hypothetical protein
MPCGHSPQVAITLVYRYLPLFHALHIAPYQILRADPDGIASKAREADMSQYAANGPESGRLGGQDGYRCTLAHLHVPSWII